jgi:DNA-directed RNA polymerase specialized sigma24 family protein
VLRAQVGDRQAIEALLRSVQPMLARYVRAVGGAPDAEDVTQDVMVLIYRKLWTLTAPDLFRPWAYRIATTNLHFQSHQIDTLPVSGYPQHGRLLARPAADL